MLDIVYTTRFKKDVKRMRKRGKNIQKLEMLVEMLINEERLPAAYHDHCLVGNYVAHRECHIEPDWLLIYKLPSNIVQLERTGTHADLF